MPKLLRFSRVRMTWSRTTTGQSPSCQYLIFEKLMYSRLKTFLDKHNMLYYHQHGVREKCSTQHALIGIVNRIQLNNDKKLFCCGIFMDRKKAFDTVNHSILMQKLEHYGFCGVENIWFSSHLNDRLPTTQVGAHVFPHCRIPTRNILRTFTVLGMHKLYLYLLSEN